MGACSLGLVLLKEEIAESPPPPSLHVRPQQGATCKPDNRCIRSGALSPGDDTGLIALPLEELTRTLTSAVSHKQQASRHARNSHSLSHTGLIESSVPTRPDTPFKAGGLAWRSAWHPHTVRSPPMVTGANLNPYLHTGKISCPAPPAKQHQYSAENLLFQVSPKIPESKHHFFTPTSLPEPRGRPVIDSESLCWSKTGLCALREDAQKPTNVRAFDYEKQETGGGLQVMASRDVTSGQERKMEKLP